MDFPEGTTEETKMMMQKMLVAAKLGRMQGISSAAKNALLTCEAMKEEMAERRVATDVNAQISAIVGIDAEIRAVDFMSAIMQDLLDGAEQTIKDFEKIMHANPIPEKPVEPDPAVAHPHPDGPLAF